MNYYEEKCHNRIKIKTAVLGEPARIMYKENREDFAGFRVYRPRNGRFKFGGHVFESDQNKNELNLYLKAVLSSKQI